MSGLNVCAIMVIWQFLAFCMTPSGSRKEALSDTKLHIWLAAAVIIGSLK